MSNPVRQLTGGAPEATEEASGLRLQSLTVGLDEVVRDEIRRCFIAECGALVEEAHLAAEALVHLRRCAARHFGILGVLTVLLSMGAVLLLAGGWLPSRRETARLRAEQATLSSSIARLSQSGGHVDLRRCGSQARLCVRVDLTSPRYGSTGDYYVLEGY